MNPNRKASQKKALILFDSEDLSFALPATALEEEGEGKGVSPFQISHVCC
jgi:hypothetical protein